MLEVGQEFSSLENLFHFIGEDLKPGGCSRQNQIKNLEKFVIFSKRGRKVRIEKILKEFDSLPERERKQRANIWLDGVTLQILNELASSLPQETERLAVHRHIITDTDSLLNYGFCNEEGLALCFKVLEDFLSPEDIQILEAYTERKKTWEKSFATLAIAGYSLPKEELVLVSENLLNKIDVKLRSKVNQVLTSCLQRLADKFIIKFSYTYLIKTKANPYFHLASEDQHVQIDAKTLETLKEKPFCAENIQDVFNKGQNAAFFKRRHVLLKQLEEPIFATKRCYSIAFTESQICNSLDYKKSLSELHELRLQINERSQTYFKKHFLEDKSESFEKRALACILERILPISEVLDLETAYEF